MADQRNDQLPPIHSRSANGTPLFEKRCSDCGAVSIVDRRKLGKPCHSCAMKRRATHGLSNHPLYRLLKNIQARCEYPSATHYAYYGGRGIRLCAEWRDNPRTFVEWAVSLGWSPGMEVDRIDSDGNYEPLNCRLVTHRQNSQRTRRIKTTPEQAAQVRRLLSAGLSVKEAARRAGVTYMVAWHIKNSPDIWRDV